MLVIQVVQNIYGVNGEDLSSEKALSIIKCAKQGSLYSELDNQCWEPFSKGPCSESELFFLSKERMTGTCIFHNNVDCEEEQVWNGTKCLEPYMDESCKGEGKKLRLNIYGNIECDCEDGWISKDGSCQQESTLAWCEQGELLQRSDCNCVYYRECDSFMEDVFQLTSLKQEKDFTNYRLGVERVACKICNQKQKEVCCPKTNMLANQFNPDELQGILKKFYEKVSLECAKNNCPVGTLPWSERPGKCIKVSQDTSSKGRIAGDLVRITGQSRSACSLLLEVDDSGEDILSCDETLDDLSLRNVPGSFRHKCRRGRIWSMFRRKCVSKFF